MQKLSTALTLRFVFALAMLVSTACKGGSDETPMLAAGNLSCYDRVNLEKALSKKSEAEISKASQELFIDGKCIIYPEHQRISNAVEISSNGLRYTCYNIWHPTQMRPAEEQSCSRVSAITTLFDIKKSRTGKFKIIERSEGYFRAECKEGGKVWLMKFKDQWQRRVLLPIEAPRSSLDDKSEVKGDPEELLQSGCKGDDF